MEISKEECFHLLVQLILVLKANSPNRSNNYSIKCDNTCNNNILGTVANFAIFTSAGAVTNAGPSGLVGDIGSDSGAISGFASATIVGSIKMLML
jgi:hypothetical protein